MMRVLEPKDLERPRLHREKKHKVRKHKHRILPFFFLLIAAYVFVVIMLPVPKLQTNASTINVKSGTPVSMPWPAYGQAAVGAVGYGLLMQNGDPKPYPIASVAKVITAVAVLKVKPMLPGSQGGTITITARDVATYNKNLEEGQSGIRVELGEQLTQYQALQALLLPSANNMADALAIWAFGSLENYLTFVNPFTKTLGMTNTNIDDSSGFSPKTTSVAPDLAKLAEIAMNHPIIAEIVGQAQAELPVAGTVYNVNSLLGKNGIVGIKTGNTDEAGGCYLFSAKRKIDSTREITVVGTVMGAPNLAKAMQDSLPLIDEAFKNFKVVTPLKANEKIGFITQVDGSKVPLVIRKSETFVAWGGQPITAEFRPGSMKSKISTGDEAGEAALDIGNMTYKLPVMAGGTIEGRSIIWRLKHAGGYL